MGRKRSVGREAAMQRTDTTLVGWVGKMVPICGTVPNAGYTIYTALFPSFFRALGP